MSPSRLWIIAAATALAVGLVACRGGGTAAPLTADEAAALVLSQEARFTGLAPRDDALIGQAGWYEVQSAGGGWQVTVRIGWGDCPSGCISEHRWVYLVSRTGDVTLASEAGDALHASSGVHGVATAGPTCPVVTEPPDPACADRPVAGAVLVVTNLTGKEITRVVTDADGRFSVDLAPGAYRLVPQPVAGLMGTAAPVDLTVEVGAPGDDLQISYDTGIR